MKKFEYNVEIFTTMSSPIDNEYYIESYELIGGRFSINVIYFPSFDKPKNFFICLANAIPEQMNGLTLMNLVILVRKH